MYCLIRFWVLRSFYLSTMSCYSEHPKLAISMIVVLMLVVAGVAITSTVGIVSYVGPTSLTCQVVNFTVTEAAWISQVGCGYNTKYSKSCNTCFTWPNQCCNFEPVNDDMCMTITLQYRLDEFENFQVWNMDVDCDTFDCTQEFRMLTSPNAIFTCYTSKSSPTPTYDKPTMPADYVKGLVLTWIYFALEVFLVFRVCKKQPNVDSTEVLGVSGI